MRWGRTTLAVVALVVGLGWVGLGPAPPAYACTCVPTSNHDLIAGADAAFVGTLQRIDDPAEGASAGDAPISSARTVVNHFEVDRVLKGDVGEQVAVESAAAGASCGIEGEPGARMGLALFRRDAAWTSSLCAKLDLAELPPPATNQPNAGGEGGNDTALLVGAIGIAVAALAAAYAGTRRPAGEL